MLEQGSGRRRRTGCKSREGYGLRGLGGISKTLGATNAIRDFSDHSSKKIVCPVDGFGSAVQSSVALICGNFRREEFCSAADSAPGPACAARGRCVVSGTMA